ncbi:MAG: alpha-ribazole phosphatase [Firmicutes bacterium]|jgi:alpha-ribazole phosphatase|nr:alpha-ribazole phosphatase [Bacillota bacterium]
MEIYLIRHGESTGNYTKKYVGWTDVDLTEKAYYQCEKLKSSLELVEFDAVFSSDLKRSIDTAYRVMGEKNIIMKKKLREINFGKFENMTYDEILLKYPEEVEKWIELGDKYVFPGGESSLDLYDRVMDEMKSILESDYKRVLIFTHGGVIRSILSHFMYGNNNGCWKFEVENCKMNVIEHRDGFSYLKSLNSL